MPKIFTSKKQKIGEFGENIAVTYLVNHGYIVIERNYTKRWGEIDIIAEKDYKIHFIEVKSVSRERKSTKYTKNYRPEENMHPLKLRRIHRTIQTYLTDREVPDDIEWQVDLICVYLDDTQRQAYIKRIDNIVS
jgi:putative endonuclease